MKKILAILVVAACVLCLASCKPETTPPDVTPIDNTEASKVHEPIFYYAQGNVPFDSENTCYPYCFITPYLAAHPTGGAVLVFPGGGYNHLSNSTATVEGLGRGVNNLGDQKEASDIAKWYNEQGISVFVVNYRTTAVDKSVCYKQILSDALRAIRFVRANAEKYFVNKDKIAVQGSSAGGHLAAMLLTRYDWNEKDLSCTQDDVDKVSARPNAAVLCYSVVSLQDGLTHSGTRSVFTGGNMQLVDEFSAELHVNAQTAPCFLWCHEGDGTVKSANTYTLYNALSDAGVECEIHVFDDNGTTQHGVGVAQDFAEAKEWPTLATEFLKNLGF